MTIQDVIDALGRVKAEFIQNKRRTVYDIIESKEGDELTLDQINKEAENTETKGGYFVVGDVAIKIEKVERLS